MEVKLRIWRQTPTADASAALTRADRHLQHDRQLAEFTVDVNEKATLLDTLDEIKNRHDGTLAYRKSCRMAVCGSCGMRIDGRAVLACKTPMKPLVDRGIVPVIAPMGNMPVIRDLVTDMTDFWAKVRAMTPWLTREPQAVPADGREHLISPEAQAKITKESLCIMCGCCVSECNSMEADPAFLGPAALAKGYRFVGDVRDTAAHERLESYNGPHGVWDCTRCYFCTERCPKGVDPRDAIAKLGAAMFDHGITGDKGARHAKVFVNSAIGKGPLYNGHLSETALIPFTLGPEAAKPEWMLMGARLAKRGKAPPPWHSMLHKQDGLDEVQKLWKILEPQESPERRGGEWDTPTGKLPPNIPKALRKQMSLEEIVERTGVAIEDIPDALQSDDGTPNSPGLGQPHSTKPGRTHEHGTAAADVAEGKAAFTDDAKKDTKSAGLDTGVNDTTSSTDQPNDKETS